jgi:hypothetical protein
MLGLHQKYHGYRTYVEAGLDDDIKEFYDRSHTAAVLGEQEFINWVRQGKLPEVKDKVLVAQVLPETFLNSRHTMFEIPRRMPHNVAPVIAIPIFRAAFTISVSKLAIELVVNMANAR